WLVLRKIVMRILEAWVVGVVPSTLKCGICQEIMDDPVMIMPCQHAYCRGCIFEWLDSTKVCPECREPTSSAGVLFSRWIQRTIDELRVKCQNVECEAILDAQSLEPHMKFECLHRIIICEKGCKRGIRYADTSTHDCMEYLKVKVQRIEQEALAQSQQIQELETTNHLSREEIIRLKDELKAKDQQLKELQAKDGANAGEGEASNTSSVKDTPVLLHDSTLEFTIDAEKLESGVLSISGWKWKVCKRIDKYSRARIDMLIIRCESVPEEYRTRQWAFIGDLEIELIPDDVGNWECTADINVHFFGNGSKEKDQKFEGKQVFNCRYSSARETDNRFYGFLIIDMDNLVAHDTLRGSLKLKLTNWMLHFAFEKIRMRCASLKNGSWEMCPRRDSLASSVPIRRAEAFAQGQGCEEVVEAQNHEFHMESDCLRFIIVCQDGCAMSLKYKGTAARGDVIQFKNCRLLLNHNIVKEDLWVRNGVIIDPKYLFFDEKKSAVISVDCQDFILAPGFIDIQINGGFGVDFTSLLEPYDENIRRVTLGVLAHGVTSVCPTLVSSAPEIYTKFRKHLKPRKGSREDGASIIGVHLEGPFLSKEKKGAHDEKVLREPVNGWDSLLEVYGQDLEPEDIAIVTLAPELKGGLKTVKDLSQRGIKVSLGHSKGSIEDGEAAVCQGASLMTHLFNAMETFHHRDPGLIGLLTSTHIPENANVWYGIIADGIHTHPAAVRIAYRTHFEGLILVTDAIQLMGLPEGTARLGTLKIEINNGRAIIADSGTLAGSIATMDSCVRHLKKFARCSVVEALEAASLHPALALGIEEKKGTLKYGSDADFVLINEDDISVKATFIAGECVWKAVGLNLVVNHRKDLDALFFSHVEPCSVECLMNNHQINPPASLQATNLKMIPPTQGCRVQMAARVRPFLFNEAVEIAFNLFPESNQILMADDTHIFTLDHLFLPGAPQKKVYEESVAPLIEAFLEGENVSVVAMGPPGGGKSYSLFGPDISPARNEADFGLLPRALRQVFHTTSAAEGVVRKISVSHGYVLGASNELRDLADDIISSAESSSADSSLLDPQSPSDDRPLREIEVMTLGEAFGCVDAGVRLRQPGAHGIFSLRLDQMWETGGVLCSSSSVLRFLELSLPPPSSLPPDLALNALYSVIYAVLLQSQRSPPPATIPYADSPLTNLMKDGLGGNGRSLLLCCLSPSLTQFMQSLNSLQWVQQVNVYRPGSSSPYVLSHLGNHDLERHEGHRMKRNRKVGSALGNADIMNEGKRDAEELPAMENFKIAFSGFPDADLALQIQNWFCLKEEAEVVLSRSDPLSEDGGAGSEDALSVIVDLSVQENVEEENDDSLRCVEQDKENPDDVHSLGIVVVKEKEKADAPCHSDLLLVPVLSELGVPRGSGPERSEEKSKVKSEEKSTAKKKAQS
ncbi:unnamed protein product, partial [Cyprideis torosa]